MRREVCDHYELVENDCPECAAEVSESAASSGYGAWEPIETAPRDIGGFLGWHKVWKMPVAVRFMSKKDGDCDEDCWVEKTAAHSWPLEAFTHWMPIPKAP